MEAFEEAAPKEVKSEEAVFEEVVALKNYDVEMTNLNMVNLHMTTSTYLIDSFLPTDTGKKDISTTEEVVGTFASDNYTEEDIKVPYAISYYKA